MSNLSHLQARITAEFNAPDRSRNRSRTPRTVDQSCADELHSLEPDDDVETARECYPALKPALAGIGLLGSAALFGTGTDIAPYMLWAGLAGVGIMGAAMFGKSFSKAPKKVPASSTAARAEQVSDRRWEQSERSQLLSSIHETLGDIAIVRDAGGKIVEANAVFSRLTGWLKPEGMTCEALGLQFEPGGDQNRHRVRIHTDAGIRIFDWHDVMVRAPAGSAFLHHSVARDITEQSRIADENDDARRRAEQESRMKSRFLATVSHEIRTPLSGILGMSHLIGQTRLTAEQNNYLAGMRQSGHALVQLVDDLLDFSSIEAGRFQLRPAAASLRETIESVVEMLSHRAHEKGIEIGHTVDAGVPGLLDVDAARLRQVLFNVVGNAVKFTAKGGVLVATSMAGETVVIRVEDTGPGLSHSEQARIFGEFEQAGDHAQQTGGSGLGLSIGRRIIAEFGGTLTVSSRLGHGSTFEIRFPARGCDLVQPAQSRKGLLSRSHVLVLSPEGPARRALEATISTLGGACDCAATLDDAKAIVGRMMSSNGLPTDIIVDNRHAGQFRQLMDEIANLDWTAVRKTYLVNPEERTGRPINQTDGYDAWLIRPLREKSLVDVLLGRMKGMEVRDAINDNRPILRDIPAVHSDPAESGVLLAEDDPVNAFLVRAMLEKAGHAVHVVSDFAALDAAVFDASETIRKAPQLIISDVNMPGGDGLSMIRRIRENESRTGRGPVPLIMLTADTAAGNRDRLLKAGANAVLSKPADPAALTGEIARLLAR